MTKGRSLKQSLGMLCGVIAAACAVLYSITLVYVLETAESKLMASVMDDMLQTVVTADILQGKPPRLDQVSRLYIEGDPSREIPDLFRHNPQGYTEFTDGEDLHTYTNLGETSFSNRRSRIPASYCDLLFCGLVFGPQAAVSFRTAD